MYLFTTVSNLIFRQQHSSFNVIQRQATGNLGPAILDALLTAGFQVTVLTRQSSTHTLPSTVAVHAVDYNSLDSLVSALQGQDAVISTLGSTAIDQQLLLVEAASLAGIKRFIPSEFGSNTLNPKTGALPTFAPKVAIQDALKKHADSSSDAMSYTVICTGPFLDWGLMVGFIMNVKAKSIALYDGGDRLFSATTLPSIGKAVAGVLRNPTATRNRAVYIHDTATTLQDLLAKGKNVAGEGWKEETVAIEDRLANAWEELRKEKPDPNAWVYEFIKASIWGEGYGGYFQEVDNELLGVGMMGEGEVKDLVGRYV